MSGATRTTTPTTIVLVRHGEAVCNVSGVVGGLRGCTGLTAAGRAQVGALAARLGATGELGAVAALYASPLRRAVETAEILAPALGRWGRGTALEPTIDCALCELHPGEADGLGWEECAARFGEPDWDRDPLAVIAPGGESWHAFVERACAAIRRLATVHHGETVVVATHAGVVEASMLRLLPIEPSVARLELLTTHASLTAWTHDRDRWTLQRYNDQARLVDAG